MTAITAEMVKELRTRTSAGMMECKKALQEAQGDMAKAEEIIAKSGHKKVAKTAGRTAAEGKIYVGSQADCAVALEINCETDFVARDLSFEQFSQKVLDKIMSAKPATLEALLALPLEGDTTVEASRQALIARLGENIQIRRFQLFVAQADEVLGVYSHQGRIGTMILLKGTDSALAKDLAMQVAAMKPQYMSPEQVPSEVIAREKDILLEVARKSGKPENVLEKIVMGQIQKQLAEICLTSQPYFKNPDQSVAALLKSMNASVLNMLRLEVGEGIEVEKKSFEEEVMATARGTNS